jgi:hypothetical protein
MEEIYLCDIVSEHNGVRLVYEQYLRRLDDREYHIVRIKPGQQLMYKKEVGQDGNKKD